MKDRSSSWCPPAFQWLAGSLLIGSFLLRIWLTFSRHLNADEFQHLHASWMVNLGYLPYRDFWENHGPVLYLLLAPLLHLIGEGVAAVFTARVLMSALGLLILLAVYRIARLDYDRLTAMLAVIILSYAEIFLQKTIEVRPDQLLVLSWLTSLWFCFRALRFEKRRTFWIAGIFVGIGMLFSPKALLCLFAASILMIAWRKGVPDVSKSLKRNLLFFTGFVVPVGCLGVYLYAQGIFGAWLEHTVFKNLTYPDTRGPTFLLLPQNLGFLLLGFAGMMLSWNDTELRSRASYHSPSLMMIPALLPFFILVFFLPSTFSQSALIFVPLFAIYAGFACKKALQWTARRTRVALAAGVLALLTAFFIPMVSVFVRMSYEETNRGQLDLLRYVLNHTAPDETIFDGNSAYIFRKQAYHYGSLVEGIRYQLKRKDIDKDIRHSLRQERCRMVLFDDRVSDLPQEIREFIHANYVPVHRETVYVAGRQLGPENLTGNKAIFRIEIPAVYKIYANGGNLSIGGRPYQDAVFLDSGIHELRSDQELRRVTLRAER